MRAVWATFHRELRAYFFSPLAYVVLFFFLVVNGFVFYHRDLLPERPALAGRAAVSASSSAGTIFFWLILHLPPAGPHHAPARRGATGAARSRC